MEKRQMEQRKAVRRYVMEAGAIQFGRNQISCVVRDISATGAGMEVSSPITVPDYFVLALPADGQHTPCQVMWRTANRIGVAFV
jgi:PilZ domain-containing protein